jgi:hypothetical protein
MASGDLSCAQRNAVGGGGCGEDMSPWLGVPLVTVAAVAGGWLIISEVGPPLFVAYLANPVVASETAAVVLGVDSALVYNKGNTDDVLKLIYGPFHRRESRTQPIEVGRMMSQNGQLWGTIPRWGIHPEVQAHVGPLGSRQGVEFYSFWPPSTAPSAYARSGIAGWLGDRASPAPRENYVQIPITITRSTQHDGPLMPNNTRTVLGDPYFTRVNTK